MVQKGVIVFISYAHEDDLFLRELDKHLSQLKWQHLIDTWYDRGISAGTEWEREIQVHLNTAHIILLLVSPDFMASKFCYSIEMKRAIERHQAEDACVIPVILRPVYWEGAPFSHLQALPTDAIPVASPKWHTRDDAFLDIVKGLHKLIEGYLTNRSEQDQSPTLLQEHKDGPQLNETTSSISGKNTYIGKQIGKYSLLKELGSGTYGRVYWGKYGFLTTRFVAIKLMHDTYLSSQGKQMSFLQEAQILLMLKKHPHILPVIDIGLYKGLPYLVTEYAPQGSLRELLNRQSAHLLPLKEVLTILAQVGQALDHAHQHNIIHRDLKPENILFDANRNALLADFGLATILTTAGNKRIEVTGTPQYMAPEQFAGHPNKMSDQYALGCIAYELLTGHTPFVAQDFVSMWFQHTYKDPVPPSQLVSQIPSHIEQAVLKALEKEPSNRYSDILNFITALHHEQSPTTLFANKSIQNELSNFDHGFRRLPLYFLLDCSRAMEGDPLLALSEGLMSIQRSLINDPLALETVQISAIYFSNAVNQTGLVSLDQFVVPTLVVGGAKRAMGAAFRVLTESIQQDLIRNTATRKGDYRPLVFLLTSGSPTDGYRSALTKLRSLRGSLKPTIVALGCGSEVDVQMLHEVTENVFLMHNITVETIRNFFQWISGSIAMISTSYESSSPTMMPPPDIPGIIWRSDL